MAVAFYAGNGGGAGGGSAFPQYVLCDTEAELPEAGVNQGDTAYAKDTLKYFKRDVGVWTEVGGTPGGEAFPVGSVFVAVVSTNPGTLLGYGTWSAIAAGRVLVGLDSGDTDFDTVEETGGAKTVTLDTTMIPAHTHVQDAHNHTQDAHNHAMTNLRGATTGGTTTGFGGIVAGSDTSSTVTAWSMPTATATNQATTATNQNAGGGGAHSNVQPYFVVYMWKRTA